MCYIEIFYVGSHLDEQEIELIKLVGLTAEKKLYHKMMCWSVVVVCWFYWGVILFIRAFIVTYYDIFFFFWRFVFFLALFSVPMDLVLHQYCAYVWAHAFFDPTWYQIHPLMLNDYYSTLHTHEWCLKARITGDFVKLS